MYPTCPCAEMNPTLMVVLSIVVVIEMVLKAFALWRSASQGQKGWFIALFVLNTAGVLPLYYLLTNKKK